MFPIARSSTWTHAWTTRCTTARTSMLDLDQRLAGALVLEAQRDAVAQLATGIQPLVEQVPWHDIAQCFQHRLLHAGMLDFEVHDQALDALPLQAEIATRRTAATDDGQPHLLAVEAGLVFTDVGERPDHDMFAAVGDQLCRHRLQRPGTEQVEEERFDEVVEMGPGCVLGGPRFGGDQEENPAPEAPTQRKGSGAAPQDVVHPVADCRVLDPV